MKRKTNIAIRALLLIIPILLMGYACKKKENVQNKEATFEKFEKLKGYISLHVVCKEDEGFTAEDRNLIHSIAKSMNQTGNEFTVLFPLEEAMLWEMTDASKVRIESALFNQDFTLLNPEAQIQGKIKPDKPRSFLRLYSGIHTDLEEVKGNFIKIVNNRKLSLKYENAELMTLKPQIDNESYTQNIQAAYIENSQEGLHFYFEMIFQKNSLTIGTKSYKIGKIKAVVTFKEKANENLTPDVIDPEKE